MTKAACGVYTDDVNSQAVVFRADWRPATMSGARVGAPGEAYILQ